MGQPRGGWIELVRSSFCGWIKLVSISPPPVDQAGENTWIMVVGNEARPALA